MASNTIKIGIMVNLISHREPPQDTTALLKEDVPITTQLQLAKNLQHWRWQFKAVEWVTRQLYKPKYSLTEKADKVKEVLKFTTEIKGEEHYWVIIMTTLLLKTISNTTIFSQTPGCKKIFCIRMANRLLKLATILEKPNQGGHRWRRIQKNMKKKLVKMGNQNAYFLCLHPDELITRMLLIPIIRMLIKTINCLDNKENKPTPPEPQPSSSNSLEEKEKEEKQPQYKPKQKKKKKKKNY
jgi:hypothetical protein